jgi:hypothetical protein
MKKIIRLTESDLIRLVKRVVKLSEVEKKRPAKRIVPTDTVLKFDYSELVDMLKKTKLYNLLDNITKVRYLKGNVRDENSGGGLRLFIYNNDGSLKYNMSINGYNRDRAINLLLHLIELNYLNGDILKELESIEMKTSDRINGLIRDIISLIMQRESIEDTIEEMVNRWFDNDYSDECRLIKQASEEVIEEMKKRYLIEIAWHYGIMWEHERNELNQVVSKIFDDCKK